MANNSTNSQQSNTGVQFEIFESVAAALQALGPSGDDCIEAGLVFGVAGEDATAYYMWTKTGTENDPVTESDCEQLPSDKIVHFSGVIDDTVSLAGVSGKISVEASEVVYLSKVNRFGYLRGISYITNWANRKLWANDMLVPRSDVLFLNINNSTLYCYEGGTLSAFSFAEAGDIILSLNSQTPAIAFPALDSNESNHAETADRATSDGEGNNIVQTYATKTELTAKQNALESAVNIKTINGQSVLGSGDLELAVEVSYLEGTTTVVTGTTEYTDY